MIDLGQLFLNSATLSETITSEVGEDKKDELALDADSFIVLMAQMLPTEDPTPPSKNTLGTSVDGDEVTQSQDNLMDVIDEGEVNQNALERLDANNALAWINSENYEPPKQMERVNPESFEALANQSTIKSASLERPSTFKESAPANEVLASERLEASRSSLFDTALDDDAIFVTHPEDIVHSENNVRVSSTQEGEGMVSNPTIDTPKIKPQPSAFVTTDMLTPVEAESLAAMKTGADEPILSDTRPTDTASPDKNPEIVESMKSFFVAKQEDMSLDVQQDESQDIALEHPIELATSNTLKDKRSSSINPYKEIVPPAKTDLTQAMPVKIETETSAANQFMETLQAVISPTVQVNATQPNGPVSVPKALEIPVALDNPEWATQFSEKVVWVGQSGAQTAVIKIHPEDLGPLEISVKVVDDLASVTITSHSSHVREMVDQALPRLREMMAENGLNLSNTSIGSDGKSRQSSQQQGNSEPSSTGYVADEKLLSSAAPKKASKGLVDYFA